MNLADLTSLYDFSGKTVVITGATGVLGGEMACALVGCHANVAMLDRNLDPAKGLLDLMGPAANRAVAFAAVHEHPHLMTAHAAAGPVPLMQQNTSAFVS